MMTRRALLTTIVFLLALAGGLPAKAGAVADFYRGKTVTIIVSSSAGGGYDTIARAIARFIGKHVPGDPVFVVKNMSGAGGMVATNYLYNTAEKDGTVAGLVQNNTPFEPLFGTKQARYDPLKFNWLGTPSVETAVVLLWHAVPVNSVDDLRRRAVNVGVSGANSTPAFFARLLNATLGTKMKLINGYPGLNDVVLAMERGEVDGHPSAFYSALSSTRPTWLRDKKAKAIVQYGPAKLPELGDVPFAPDLVANADDKRLMQAAFAPLALGRPLLLPPGVPRDRVAALRAGLAATFSDPAFLAEGKRLGLQINSPRTGEQIQALLEDTYKLPPALLDRLRKLNKP